MIHRDLGEPVAGPLIDALTGVCPVLAVPFYGDESLDLDGFLAGAADVAAAGVTSVMWPGFASEFHKLTAAEVDLLRDALLAAAPDLGLKVIIAVQDHATRSAVERSMAAMAAGAVGINVLPPFFLAPSSAAVLDHLDRVCGELAGVGGEVVLQYAPGFTGASVELSSIVQLCTAHPNLRAVKVETPAPGPAIRELAAAGIASTVGMAGLHMVEAHAAGAVGVQPGSGFVRLYTQIWRQLQSGDIEAGRAAHRELLPALVRWMDSVEHIVAADKAVLERRGVIRDRTVRQPGRRLDPEDEALVESITRQLDVGSRKTSSGE